MSAAIDKLRSRMQAVDSCLCVGLDPVLDKLPVRFQQEEYPFFAFNSWIIGQTHELAAAYKPNSAFYEARGEQGLRELRLTVEYLQHHHPDIFLIDDAKRADIDSTNDGYVHAVFDDLGFDAITLHPYLGRAALAPFLQRSEKACIILCRTSNPGAGELQDQKTVQGKMIWEVVAEKVAQDWNEHNNCMLVVGATYPDELKRVREIVGEEMIFLVPGVGAQGGSMQTVLEAGSNSQGEGLLVNASRGIIFADDPRAEARNLVQESRRILQ